MDSIEGDYSRKPFPSGSSGDASRGDTSKNRSKIPKGLAADALAKASEAAKHIEQAAKENPTVLFGAPDATETLLKTGHLWNAVRAIPEDPNICDTAFLPSLYEARFGADQPGDRVIRRLEALTHGLTENQHLSALMHNPRQLGELYAANPAELRALVKESKQGALVQEVKALSVRGKDGALQAQLFVYVCINAGTEAGGQLRQALGDGAGLIPWASETYGSQPLDPKNGPSRLAAAQHQLLRQLSKDATHQEQAIQAFKLIYLHALAYGANPSGEAEAPLLEQLVNSEPRVTLELIPFVVKAGGRFPSEAQAFQSVNTLLMASGEGDVDGLQEAMRAIYSEQHDVNYVDASGKTILDQLRSSKATATMSAEVSTSIESLLLSLGAKPAVEL